MTREFHAGKHFRDFTDCPQVDTRARGTCRVDEGRDVAKVGCGSTPESPLRRTAGAFPSMRRSSLSRAGSPYGSPEQGRLALTYPAQQVPGTTADIRDLTEAAITQALGTTSPRSRHQVSVMRPPSHSSRYSEVNKVVVHLNSPPRLGSATVRRHPPTGTN